MNLTLKSSLIAFILTAIFEWGYKIFTTDANIFSNPTFLFLFINIFAIVFVATISSILVAVDAVIREIFKKDLTQINWTNQFAAYFPWIFFLSFAYFEGIMRGFPVWQYGGTELFMYQLNYAAIILSIIVLVAGILVYTRIQTRKNFWIILIAIGIGIICILTLKGPIPPFHQVDLSI